MAERPKLVRVNFRGNLLGGETVKAARAEFVYDSGEKMEGVAKVFADKEAAQKEIDILKAFEQVPQAGVARVLDVRENRELGFEVEGVVVLESVVAGEPVGRRREGKSLEEVQKKSAMLFAQLEFLAGNEELIRKDMAYCGDVSPANVLDTSRGYAVVDWSGRFGVSGAAELTKGYIAPEILKNTGDERYVLMDTYSLGCLLARILLGVGVFETILEKKGEDGFMTAEDVRPWVSPVVQGFFKVALAENPRQRSFSGENDPGQHYRRLGRMFKGEM